MAKLTVLAIGAHADPFDMPYQCGGTLAKMAKEGNRVICVSSCEENQEEATRVAKVLGCETMFLDLEEGEIQNDTETVHKIVELIRSVKPDIVITHQPTDYNPDHRALSQAVLGACLLARVGEVKTKHKPYKVPCLYYSETSSGVNSTADIYVDIESTFKTKIKALKEHKSLYEKEGVEHLGSIEHLIEREETTARYRGMQVEIEYAEAFSRAVNYRVMRAFSTLPFPDVEVQNK
ncbi:PIG-L deacetylase family protein [Methanocella sp. MCL-LM]|uniref:PIG-L deacetylase family protein n=1 Tax=Methanocella sp. MCL-LM TaxID=3412035 RepID=UPI003C74C2D2